MIGALERAFKAVYSEIPLPILEAAFTPMKYDVSLDERIKQEVILKRVREDASINGGKTKTILLSPAWVKFMETPSPYAVTPQGAYTSYHIPAFERDNRDIVAIINVQYPHSVSVGTGAGYYGDRMVGGRNLSNITASVLRSHTFSHACITPTVVIKEGNILKLSPPQYAYVPWQVTVRLRYDEEFVNMEISSVEPFAQCVVQATKAYIYNKLIFEIESNAVYHGMEIGVMKDIVSSYSEANERYTEALANFAGGEFFDPERTINILRNMVGRV